MLTLPVLCARELFYKHLPGDSSRCEIWMGTGGIVVRHAISGNTFALSYGFQRANMRQLGGITLSGHQADLLHKALLDMDRNEQVEIEISSLLDPPILTVRGVGPPMATWQYRGLDGAAWGTVPLSSSGRTVASFLVRARDLARFKPGGLIANPSGHIEGVPVLASHISPGFKRTLFMASAILPLFATICRNEVVEMRVLGPREQEILFVDRGDPITKVLYVN